MFMPDAISATTFPVSWLGDRLRICWLADPEATVAGNGHYQALFGINKVQIRRNIKHSINQIYVAPKIIKL